MDRLLPRRAFGLSRRFPDPLDLPCQRSAVRRRRGSHLPRGRPLHRPYAPGALSDHALRASGQRHPHPLGDKGQQRAAHGVRLCGRRRRRGPAASALGRSILAPFNPIRRLRLPGGGYRHGKRGRALVNPDELYGVRRRAALVLRPARLPRGPHRAPLARARRPPRRLFRARRDARNSRCPARGRGEGAPGRPEGRQPRTLGRGKTHVLYHDVLAALPHVRHHEPRSGSIGISITSSPSVTWPNTVYLSSNSGWSPNEK